MSLVTMYESSVKRKKDEIARLKKDRVRYVNEVSNCSKKILTATKQANSTKSQSTLKSKLNEIERENKRKSDAEKKITDYDKKIANKEKELLREEENYIVLKSKNKKNMKEKDNKLWMIYHVIYLFRSKHRIN